MLNNMPIIADYDYKYDIFTITKKEKYEYKKSIELEPGIILDFDVNNFPVSLEILDASKIFNIKKSYLTSPNNVNMLIKISAQVISVEVKLSIMFHQKKTISSFDSKTINDVNAPIMNANLVTA